MIAAPIVPRAALAVAAAFALTGCPFKRADTSPPTVTVSAPPAAPEPLPEGPISEPQTQTRLPSAQPASTGAAPSRRGPFAYEPAAPAAPPAAETSAAPAPARSPAAPAAPAAEAPPPVEAAAAESAPPPLPALAPLLSDDQRAAYGRDIERNKRQTEASLASVAGRLRSADQSAAVRRIREFLRQADDVRERDLILARNLTERARLLAEDLARSSR